MDNHRRQHPAAILRYTGRFIFLLLVPLFRGSLHIRSPYGIYAWLRGGWVDLLTVGLLLALSWLSWWLHTYRLTPESLTVRRGILVRRTTVIPLRFLTTLTVERRFLYRPFGVVRVTADTDAGHRRMADVSLLVGRREAVLFSAEKADAPVYRPSYGRLVLLSLFFSNSLSGVVLLAVTLRQAGLLLGEGVGQLVLEGLQAAAGAVTVIPRTAALLGLVLLGGWLVTAVGHLLRHLPFSAQRREDLLVITTGWLTRRTHTCAVKAVHYADFRRTLPALLTGRGTVYICCTGYGKDKNTLAVLIPPTRPKQADAELSRLLPSYLSVPLTVRPGFSALWRYVRLPLLTGLSLWLFAERLAGLLPSWAAALGPLVGVGVLPCGWLLAMRVAAFRLAGLGCADGRLTLSTWRRLTLHRVTVPLSHVTTLRLRQSPFQRLSGRCDVWIYTANEARHPYRIRHLPLWEVERLPILFRKEE